MLKSDLSRRDRKRKLRISHSIGFLIYSRKLNIKSARTIFAEFAHRNFLNVFDFLDGEPSDGRES